MLGGKEGLECEVLVNGTQLEYVSEFNTYCVFWMNKLKMMPNVVGKSRVRGKLRVVSDFWGILGVCNLSVRGYCMRHYLCLFFCRLVKQWY